MGRRSPLSPCPRAGVVFARRRWSDAAARPTSSDSVNCPRVPRRTYRWSDLVSSRSRFAAVFRCPLDFATFLAIAHSTSEGCKEHAERLYDSDRLVRLEITSRPLVTDTRRNHSCSVAAADGGVRLSPSQWEAIGERDQSLVGRASGGSFGGYSDRTPSRVSFAVSSALCRSVWWARTARAARLLLTA